jgi:hypothetical protein
VSSPAQDRPGIAAAIADGQKVVDAMTAATATTASVLPEHHGFTAGSHNDVQEKLASLADNQFLGVIAAKIRGGDFEEAELFAPDARMPGTGYVSATRTVSYDDLVKEGRYNLFYKVYTFGNAQAAGGSLPDAPGTSSSTTHQQHTTPQPAPASLRGRAQQIYDYLNNPNSPRATNNPLAATLNGTPLIYSPRQAEIFKYLIDNPEKTPGEIDSVINNADASSTLTAMLKNGLVVRERTSKRYRYSVPEELPVLEYPSS